MLRRTNASRLPIHGGRSIGDQLPGLVASTIVVTSTPRETEDYHICASQIPEKQRLIPRKLETATGDTGYDSTSPNTHYGCLPVFYFREPVPAVKKRKRGRKEVMKRLQPPSGTGRKIVQLPNIELCCITRLCPLHTPLVLEPQVWKPLLNVPRETTVYLVLSGLDALTSDERSWNLLAEKLQGLKGLRVRIMLGEKMKTWLNTQPPWNEEDWWGGARDRFWTIFELQELIEGLKTECTK